MFLQSPPSPRVKNQLLAMSPRLVSGETFLPPVMLTDTHFFFPAGRKMMLLLFLCTLPWPAAGQAGH